MNRPRLLDLFCGAGGAGMGYYRAGFDVVGVDINPQPRYPFEFHQGDALKFLLENWQVFDAFHASPPCQAYTNAQKIQGNEHPDFIEATRSAFDLIDYATRRVTPWCIENVPGAPLRRPIELCGCMFDGTRTYRPRLFESGGLVRPEWLKRRWFLAQPEHRPHVARTTKMGRPPKSGEFMHVVGNFSGVKQAREAMGIDWMTRDELRESIPPAYTEYIGAQLIAALEVAA